MSYFGTETFEETIYEECEHHKGSSGATNVDIIHALTKVLEVYAERAAQGY